MDDFANGLALRRGALTHYIAQMVADDVVEVRDDADRVFDVAAADLGVRGDASDAAFTQRIACVDEQVDGLDERLCDDGLHDIELELTGLGGHGGCR